MALGLVLIFTNSPEIGGGLCEVQADSNSAQINVPIFLGLFMGYPYLNSVNARVYGVRGSKPLTELDYLSSIQQQYLKFFHSTLGALWRSMKCLCK